MDQTAAYIDGMLQGEEIQVARDHLSTCDLCSLAVADLSNFKGQIANNLSYDYRPAIAARSERGRLLLSRRFMFTAGVFATAIAALLLIATSWWIWTALRRSTPVQTVQEKPIAAITPAATPAVVLSASPAQLLIAQITDGGGMLTLDHEGRLSGADGLPDAYQRMVKEALSRQRVEESPLLSALKRPASSLLGTREQGAEFSVSEPVGEVVLSDRPIFRWSKWESSASYVVEIYDEAYNLVASSPPQTGYSWRPPHPLKRDEIYTWQVKARKDEKEALSPQPPAPQAKFRILASARVNEIVRARQAYASSHLMLALLYEKDGLLTEAENELHSLAKANPDSEVVHRLSADVNAMRRR
jgi:hypothetical protein